MNTYKSIMAKHRRMEAHFLRNLRVSMYRVDDMPPTEAEVNYYQRAKVVWFCIIACTLIMVGGCHGVASAEEYTPEQYCQAIWHTEGGLKTSHPYGIMTKYKHTTPLQACLNTVKHQRRLWVSKGKPEEFTVFLGRTYSPPDINPNWVRLTDYFLARSK